MVAVSCQMTVYTKLIAPSVLEERIARTNQWIAAFMKNSVLCQKIQAIDGVGPITATAMVAAVDDAGAGVFFAAFTSPPDAETSGGGDTSVLSCLYVDAAVYLCPHGSPLGNFGCTVECFHLPARVD